MVAQQLLELPVGVRIPARQPSCYALRDENRGGASQRLAEQDVSAKHYHCLTSDVRSRTKTEVGLRRDWRSRVEKKQGREMQ